MGVSYLKVPADDAYRIVDDLIVAGFQARDLIVQAYRAFSATPDVVPSENLVSWEGQANGWCVRVINALEEVFISQAEPYEFRDANPPFGATSANIRFFTTVSKMKARIDKLIEFRNTIRDRFDVHLEVVLGNKIEQIGSGNSVEINPSI
jgi:hypothetical protein